MSEFHEFLDEVRQCGAEIEKALPTLADRHSPLVTLAALAEHVGGALFLAQEAKLCTREQVVAIVKRIEHLVFPDETVAALEAPSQDA